MYVMYTNVETYFCYAHYLSLFIINKDTDENSRTDSSYSKYRLDDGVYEIVLLYLVFKCSFQIT